VKHGHQKQNLQEKNGSKCKQKKYIDDYVSKKCTPASLCDVYHVKSKEKVLNMRSDTLAQILSQASIAAGRRALIIDSVLGLVVGSAAYRMQGHGVIFGFGGQQPHFEVIDLINLNEKLRISFSYVLLPKTPKPRPSN